MTINEKGKKVIRESCQSIIGFKGVIVFYLSIENTNIVTGDAELFPLNSQFVFLYPNSALLRDLSHEVGHILGLQHSFYEFSDYISRIEKKIEKGENLLKENKLKLGQPKYAQERIKSNISKLNKYIGDNKQKIEDHKFVIKDNPYKFKQGSTTNLMDYFDNENVYMSKDFYKWQWLVMQKDIKKYYN